MERGCIIRIRLISRYGLLALGDGMLALKLAYEYIPDRSHAGLVVMQHIRIATDMEAEDLIRCHQ